MLKVLRNWGDLFKIEFSIKVTKRPKAVYTNVFHFTANGNDCRYYGDRIPALFIHRGGYFVVSSSVSGHTNFYRNFKFEWGKQYQVTIQQLKDSGKYWYEIIINGVSKLKIENKKAKRFSSVKLYASDPWYPPFTSNLGSISHIKIQQAGG